MTTLWSAGCLCSAFEFNNWSAVEDRILTASVFSLVRGFEKVDTTLIVKLSMSPFLLYLLFMLECAEI